MSSLFINDLMLPLANLDLDFEKEYSKFSDPIFYDPRTEVYSLGWYVASDSTNLDLISLSTCSFYRLRANIDLLCLDFQ